ncbi:VOC family protein [Stomatohabitans albus]|uniref:VOC family protein n=1 Tax=Stomatohabitans albus TaxID=3110766 RepID=UPI00300CDFEF
MANRTLVPFIRFSKGECNDAVTFYQQVLGGELVVTTFAEHGIDSVEDPSKVMWSQLSINDAFVLMASDGLGETFTHGTNVSLSMLFDDLELAQRTFAQLSEGGEIQVPFGLQSFGQYGDFIDRFGVHWMVFTNDGSED